MRLVGLLAKVPVAAACGLPVLLSFALLTPEPAPVAAASSVGSPAAAPSALGVLAGWDARRADAWARGDLAGLARLYVPGSEAGMRDSANLTAYVDRGLVVTGLLAQVLAYDVLRETADLVVIRVTDRAVGGVAVGAVTRVSLPVGRPRTREVTLRRGPHGWLVVEVLSR